ncbi:MAG TPA: hypothetical protein PK325_07170 [Cyclobacteriaceae bacterium]|nr:hypothetical protein [Cyclobacteriaceae bacterium]HMV09406.1 hypothetical protein [Cyclobacteriaceae bacterium]HMX02427.1 hypothetical protein [Cyclobacteriaceae bacterium]HMX51085.1 hypothetical protein [Cyclobacteriaceae bacterium]HMY91747.1 hypothetical protein [Cyclobacteriaceae bacterium]
MASTIGFFGKRNGKDVELSDVTFSVMTGRTFSGCMENGSLVLKNTGNRLLYFSCPFSSNGEFTWGSLSNNPLLPNESAAILVSSNGNTEVEGIMMTVFFSQQPITPSNPGTPRQLKINRRLPIDAPRFADAFSVRLNANPPGNDLDPAGGEYLEIEKVNDSLINLQYCQINHLQFSASRLLNPQSVHAFSFDKDLIPQNGQVIRIYTRPEHVDDRINNPNVDYFFYLNLQKPIWNNRAPERAIFLNQQLEIIQITPSPIAIPPPSSSGSTTSNTILIDNLLLACDRWNLVATVQEGDIIRVSGPGSMANPVQGSYRWFNFGLNTRTRNADGREFDWGREWFELAPPHREDFGYFPMPDQNKWGLIGLLSNTERLDLNRNYNFDPDKPDGQFVYIGYLNEFQVIQSRNSPVDFTKPVFFYLGVNDNKLDDNSGFFLCRVTVF